MYIVPVSSQKRWQKLKAYIRSIFPVFAVKPLLVIYMMSWAVTESVSTQLWIDKTCRINLNFTGRCWACTFVEFGFLDAVCDDLTNPANNEANNEVQVMVNNFKLYGNYIDDIPQMLISLYIGPLSGSNNKREWKPNRATFVKILEENLWWWFHFLGISYPAPWSFSMLCLIHGMLVFSGFPKFTFSLVATLFLA